MNFIKKWIAKVARESMYPAEEMRVNKQHDMFQNNLSAMMAYKIDNGYVVCWTNNDTIGRGERIPGFTYCADHQAIADHIVSSAAREKLGVQQDMFAAQRKQVNVVRKSQTAGLVGTQQANPSY